MRRSPFHTASAEEIRAGKVTDVYFARTQEILKAKGLDRRAGVAEFTVGELPLGWPWGIFCGLEEAVSLLEGLPVDLQALPEGTLFPARDETGVRVPVMTIAGAYGRFCLHETPALGLICQATGVATRAARIRLAAGSSSVIAFGTRRMHPAIAPMLDRASYLGGCDAVSNFAGARLIGRPPQGTMPHALIVVLGDPQAAWEAFDRTLPRSVPRVALIDTYSDEKAEALLAARTLGKRLDGVRLDTPASRRGNLAELVREVRWELGLRGFSRVRVIVSGGIGEEQIPPLVAAGADGFGVGTAISNAPTVDFAMDLVEMEGRPCAKRGKFGGRKEPYRCSRCLGVRVIPSGAVSKAPRCSRCRAPMKGMFRRYLKSGKRVSPLPPVDSIRSFVLDQLKRV
ncbi:MAG: nicotinate phosphoribosyltransferase [Candidatus Omnitrophica bacterium]|nr:nicotinate phosphoribosyltransferase [Candidatus Omnitrophota bacterium]